MVATVLAPLLGGVIGAVTNNVVALAIKLAEERHRLGSNFVDDIKFMKSELLMIAGDEEEQLTEELRDVALEIEDLLGRVLRYVVKREAGPLHRALGFTDALQLQADIGRLKQRLVDAYQRNSNHSRQLSAVSTTPTGNTYTTKVGPVGIEDSTTEICEWVLKDVEDEPEQLSVISIVGFSGSGKSTLAKAVYDCTDVANKFSHRAWVVASKHVGDTGTKGLLKELLQILSKGDKNSDSDDVEQLHAKISNYLKEIERYLIVFDDINKKQWFQIENIFHENKKGRIIVTTTTQEDAYTCSSGDGFVYSMRPLDGEHSKELLKAVLNKELAGFEQSSDLIVNKCDGHPLALVSVAKYLRGKIVFTENDCKGFWSGLGDHIKGSGFEELEQVLKNYRCLPAHPVNLKTCLLYMSVFPNGHPIGRKRLMGRWLAEGIVQQLETQESLEELVERNIIWPLDSRKNAKVKTCRAHSIMHELMLHVSKSTMFVSSLENNPDRSNYRHLFIQNGVRSSPAHGDMLGNKKEYRAHSLTICGSAGDAVEDFPKCALLRVLDLEECCDLQDKELDVIQNLWYLKYLSVGDTISRLPKNIEKLHFLETLDTRKTNKEILLPAEVIKLPYVAHLLGRFKLDKRDWDKRKPEEYVPNKSNLQTLAGFVTDHNHGFPMLMLYLKQLRKVKIWHNSTDRSQSPHLERAIKKFVQADLGTGAVRSLSLDIGNISRDILTSLAGGCLRSLKLHGELKGLVQFAALLSSVRELRLSSTNDLTTADLSELRNKFKDLLYLKLVGVDLGGFVIESQDFPGLQRLCLVQCPSLPTIREGALPQLISLRLLNQGLDGLSGINIKWHNLLQEVALDSEVCQDTKLAWEKAARTHQKRPRVLYLKRVHPSGTGSMVKYVATVRTVTGSPTMLVEQASARVESNSVKEPNNDLNNIEREDPAMNIERVPEPPLASTEICSVMEIGMTSSSTVMSS